MATPRAVTLGSLLESRSGFRDGRPCLKGTGITVHAVAAAHLSGLSAEEICQQNQDLDPSLFHAALAYYYANRLAVEADLEADEANARRLAERFPEGITPDNVDTLA